MAQQADELSSVGLMRALTNGGYLLRSNPNRLRLADHARLAQSDKNVFEQMRRPEQHEEQDGKNTEIGVRHRVYSGGRGTRVEAPKDYAATCLEAAGNGRIRILRKFVCVARNWISLPVTLRHGFFPTHGLDQFGHLTDCGMCNNVGNGKLDPKFIGDPADQLYDGQRMQATKNLQAVVDPDGVKIEF